MNQQVILNRIRTLLARFQEEVKIDNANGEFSINLHAENLLLKLLNTTYGWDLQNVNYEEGKTFAAIDLRDEARKVAVQVTSSGTVDKVVHTLEQCVDKGYDTKYEHLYFYFLKGMDKNVKVDYPRIARSLGQYRPECVHFLDHAGFYLELNRLNDLEKCRQIKALLEEQFTDLPLGGPGQQKKTFTNKDLIVPFTQGSSSGAQGNTYVPRHDLLDKIAACYDSQEGNKRLAFLSGMGGCGKSELARAYANEHKGEYEEIFWLTCRDGETPELMALFSAAKTNYTVEKADVAIFTKEILIIVDNCNKDDPGFLHDLMNGTGNADILVTTRLPIMGDYDEQMVAVESDDPERFAFAVFEKNYCKKPRWGRRKEIGDHEKTAVLDICREVQCNTMVVSLIGVRLREYNNLSISECAEKIRGGVSAIKGRITYPKDQNTRSEEMKDILCFLFSDILNYPLSDAQKEILTLLSLTPATWYEMDFIFMLAGDGPQDTEHEYAAKTLLSFGWLQGTEDRMTIHPLIAEAIEDELIIIHDSAYFEAVLMNYLALPDRYLGCEQFLINKAMNLAFNVSPEIKISVMLLINHGGYKKLFSEMHPDVNVAYFVYVNLKYKRLFEYRDLDKKETCLIAEIACRSTGEKTAHLLKIYNTGVPYTLNLDVDFHGVKILKIPSGICRKDTYLRRCILGDCIKIIESVAFEDCSRLTEKIYLPKTLTSIGNKAFKGCYRLTGDLQIPDGLTHIGEGAFDGCTSLTGTLHLPESLISIGARAFNCCRYLSGQLHLPDVLSRIENATFTHCIGLNGELLLPDNLSSIGEWAFAGCKGLSGELHLPDNLISIGHSAFAFCSSLSGNLNLPNNLTNIEPNTFEGCNGMTGRLHLPNSLIRIGHGAFSGCSALTGALQLPDALTTIEYSAFEGCNSLTGTLHLPNNLINIGHSAFSGCSALTGALRLPDALTTIEYSAFEGCSGLTNILQLPPSLISIGPDSFSGCSGLTGELLLPDSLISIGDRAFFYCSGLTGELHFPDRLTTIGDCAFTGCSGLTGELQLPDALTTIGNHAFTDCIGLTGKLHLPDNLIMIGDDAFSGCSILTEASYIEKDQLNTDENASENYIGFVGELHLPDNLTSIKDKAFFYNHCITGELCLPDSLNSIGNHAFAGCSGLTGKLNLPDSLIKIGEGAFADCAGLNGELQLPDSLISIGKGAFAKCAGLVGELHLPNSLIRIESTTFFGCGGLSGELHLPNNLISIGDFAFSHCIGIRGELFLPDCLTSIGNGAFWGCIGLNGYLHLSGSLTNIGNSSFRDCTGLIGELQLPDTLTNIGVAAFAGCHGLNGTLHLPNCLTSIGNCAFDGCSGFIGELHLPDNLRSIGNRSFDGCRIEKIIFNNRNTEIQGDLIPYSDVIICGYRNSTAEKYALSKGLVFEELKPKDK